MREITQLCYTKDVALHQTAIAIRRTIALSIIGMIVFTVVLTSFDSIKRWWQQLHPSPEPPPTTGFGKLPALHLPTLTIKGNPAYSLETATGELPSLPDRAKVIAVKEITPSLLGEQRANDLAKSLGFAGESNLSGDKRSLIFRDTGDKRTLTINLTTQFFSLSTDLDHIERTVPKGSALNSAGAVQKAQGFLKRNGLQKGGYDIGTQTTQIHQVTNGIVEDAPSVSEGQFTRVDFFRTLTNASTGSFSILPANPKIGLVQVWVTSGLDPDINNILAASYIVWELDKEKAETYPLRSVASAWEEVKEGKGIAEVLVEGSSPLDTYVPLNVVAVSVREVRLAYFDDSSYQEYLQPIYVFSGSATTAGGKEADFTAYRPAISTEWIQE